MKNDNNDNNNREGDWCVVSVDRVILRAKLVHKGRGRFRIVDDNKDGKYIDWIADASDIIQVEK